VELSDGHVVAPFAPIDEIKGARELMHALEIDPVQMHMPLTVDTTDPSPSAALKQLKKALDYAAQLEADVAVCHLDTLQQGGGTGSRLDACFDPLVELVEHARNLGIKVALENFPQSNPLGRMEHLLEVVRTVGGPNLGICVDTGHANMGHGLQPWRAIEMADELLIAVHLQDNNGGSDMHLPPGFGEVDWGRVMEALTRVGYAGGLIIESAPPFGWLPSNVVDAAIASFEAKILDSIELLGKLCERHA